MSSLKPLRYFYVVFSAADMTGSRTYDYMRIVSPTLPPLQAMLDMAQRDLPNQANYVIHSWQEISSEDIQTFNVTDGSECDDCPDRDTCDEVSES